MSDWVVKVSSVGDSCSCTLVPPWQSSIFWTVVCNTQRDSLRSSVHWPWIDRGRWSRLTLMVSGAMVSGVMVSGAVTGVAFGAARVTVSAGLTGLVLAAATGAVATGWGVAGLTGAGGCLVGVGVNAAAAGTL